jgi:hypothetical protein
MSGANIHGDRHGVIGLVLCIKLFRRLQMQACRQSCARRLAVTKSHDLYRPYLARSSAPPISPTLVGIIRSGFEDFRLPYQIRSPGTALPAPTSKSVLSGHRVLNFESETLSGDTCWIGEKRLIDRGQREFGTALCEQHLAGACANGTVFRKPR